MADSSGKGVLGATTLVLLTTIDNVVWLAPFVAATASRKIAILHGFMFLATLVSLALLVSLGTLLLVHFGGGTVSDVGELDFWLQLFSVLLCWSIAGYLIYKRCQKLRKRRELKLQRESQDGDYGSIPMTLQDNDEGEDDEEDHEEMTSAKPLLIMSMTFMSFLDEIAYFPPLILGQIFTATELCLATLIAGSIMLMVVTVCLTAFQPFIEWLGRNVKLYMIVTTFAIILTAQLIFED